MLIAIDWDETLVHGLSQKWLPGAQEALRRIHAAGHEVIVHSCRANHPDSYAALCVRLSDAGLPFRVWHKPGKPAADVYIDDRGVHFDGEWGPIVAQLERRKMARSVKQRRQPVKH